MITRLAVYSFRFPLKDLDAAPEWLALAARFSSGVRCLHLVIWVFSRFVLKIHGITRERIDLAKLLVTTGRNLFDKGQTISK